MKIPAYVFLGFLESGKTTFISETLGRDFADGQRTLLIACEEGEEEYDEKLLKRSKTTLATVGSEEDFSPEFIKRSIVQYKPDRVLLEYNGMWSVAGMLEKLEAAKLELYQTIMMIDASTFTLYMNNMRSMAVEMFKISELVIFIKCRKEMNLNSFRRSIKAVNPRVQVGFDMIDGSEPDAEEMLPYDLNADIVEIDDVDYGIFHMDIMENPKRYAGKKVRFRAIVCKPEDLKEGFIPGRFAMTCCADDIQFIGYIAKRPKLSPLPEVKNRDWIMLTALVKFEFSREYRGKGPVYYPLLIEPAEKPEEDIIYF